MDTPPLVLAGDEQLREQLSRLAAAAGTSAEVLPGSGPEALAAWWRAPAVLLGAEEAVALAHRGAPRRAGVLVCCVDREATPDPRAPDPRAPDPSEDPVVLRAALALGAEQVVALPRDEGVVSAALADLDESPATGPVVAVVGGSGGAGTSVLAAALATRAAVSGPTLLADLDPGGPGAARLLGLDDDDRVGWPDLARGAGRLGAGALREAVPRTPAGVGVLGWPGATTPPGATTVREAVAAAARGHHAVVADLPRSDLVAHRELLGVANAVVVVARATLPGACAAGRLLSYEPLADPATARRTLLVVRGGPSASGRLGRALGHDPVAVLREQPGLPELLDLGVWPLRPGGRPPRGRNGALARAADAVWRSVGGGPGGGGEA